MNYKFTKQIADTLTPIGIFKRLTGKNKFLLESSFHNEQKGKYSFIGVDPYQQIIGKQNETKVIHQESGTSEIFPIDALQYMKQYLPKIETELPLPFQGGAIGYVGYDAIRQYEDIGEILPDELNMPDIHFMIYKNVFVFDHANEIIYLIAMNPENETEQALDKRLNELENQLKNEPDHLEHALTNVDFQPEMTEEKFKEKVTQAKQLIQQGEMQQIVLSQRFKAAIDGDPFSFYRKLRNANPSPYMFYIEFTDYLVLGASPESLIQTTGKELITNPIAGTRPRGKTNAEDALLVDELLSDKKEISEHEMLVELSKKDLGLVSENNSLSVPTYMAIEKYQYVMHIVSKVQGKLKENLSSIDALIACLPAGTVSGAPKVHAMQVINDYEEAKRGVYGGGIGYINFNHDLNIALAIRSLVIKDNHAYLQAGAGIVQDSVPANEFAETLHKAKSLMTMNDVTLVN
jgi:anthranilate synthase component 1